MNHFILVFIGGGLGSYARFWLANWVLARTGATFPYGTLTVNLIGCLLIGMIAGLPNAGASLPPQARLLFMIGILGGFTTFSTYEYESFMLVTGGEFGKALLNLGLSVAAGFLSLALGYLATRLLLQLLKGG